MQTFSLNSTQRVLCLGAHADDIEIGCGGTILKWLRHAQVQEIWWVVFSGTGERQQEAQQSAQRYLKHCPRHKVHFYEFKDAYFPAQWSEIKAALHAIGESFQPDIVLTHRTADAHQDHRLVGELTWNAFRNHVIYEYEIPKFDGDLLPPNVYSVVSEADVDEKVTGLLNDFPSQQTKPWFDEESFRAIMRIRGLECHADTRWAEAFHCRKLCC